MDSWDYGEGLTLPLPDWDNGVTGLTALPSKGAGAW